MKRSLVEAHCHGIGDIDFSAVRPGDITRAIEYAEQENVALIPTFFLSRQKFLEAETIFMECEDIFQSSRAAHLMGVALEGPLLSSSGGTPVSTCWSPTRSEWSKIFSWGERGLKYVVLSPDAMTSPSGSRGAEYPPDILWVVEGLLDAGIRPALGHYRKNSPEMAAQLTVDIVNIGRRYQHQLKSPILTDHLFNDMPVKCKYAWRDPAARANRTVEIESSRIRELDAFNVAAILGPLSAALFEAAMQDLLTIFINFDNDHVDLAFSREVLRVLSARRVIAMTDRLDAPFLASTPVSRVPHSSLWYQEQAIVAAGSTSIGAQRELLQKAGVGLADIDLLTSDNAHGLFCS